MTIAFDTENATSSDGWNTNSAYCPLPSSGVDDYVLLVIGYGNWLGLSTSLTTPTIPSVTVTPVSTHSRVAIHSIPGGTVGSANFTFTTNPSSFWAWCVRVSGVDRITPFSGASSAATTAYTHLLNAATTAPLPGAVFLGAAGAPASAGGYFDSADNIAVFVGGFADAGGVNGALLSVAIEYAASAGALGNHNWNKVPSPDAGGGVFGSLAGIWLHPLQAPSAPVVLTPTANERITAGKQVDVTYLAATDPTVSSELLEYEGSYTYNNGITNPLIGTTAPGILTLSWDTTGLLPGIYKVRVRADNGTDFGDYGYSEEFRIFADTVPGPPTELSPTGYISKSSNQTFSWKANNPDADTPSAYELEWDTDPAMGSTATTGTVVSVDSFHIFTANLDILLTVGTYYWRVRTKGFVDNTFGPWSQIKTVIVATPPAAPNITAPLAASPPTVGQFTVLFTSTAAHVAYKYRIEQGATAYNSGWILGSVTQFQIAIRVANSVACTLYLAVKDSTGLESAEDSETFTPSYTGPTTPLLDLTVDDNKGTIQCAITNPVTVLANHSRLLRWEDGEAESTAIYISPKLPNNSTFIHAQARSGITYNFRVRAFLLTGGFSDSTIETATTEFTELQIHTVTKTSIVSDADLSVSISIEGKTTDHIEKNQESVEHLGRVKRLTYAGVSGNYERMSYNCSVPRSDPFKLQKLLAIFNANTKICSRDRNGILLFGKFLNVDLNRILTDDSFPIEVIEQTHRESIR